MAEAPGILRGFRLADALALGVCAAVLGHEGVQAAFAVGLLARSGTDPSLAGGLVAWQVPGGGGRVRRGDATTELDGSHRRWAGRTSPSGPATPSGSCAPRTARRSPRSRAPAAARWRCPSAGWSSGPRPPRATCSRRSPWRTAPAGRSPGAARPRSSGARRSTATASSSTTRDAAAASCARSTSPAAAPGRCASRAPARCSTPPCATAGCSTSTPPPSASGCDSGERRRPRRHRRPHRLRPAAHRTARRRPRARGHGLHHAGYPHGRRPPAPERPPRGVTRTLWTTALSERNAYVARLRHRAGGATESVLLRVSV